jgi:hypothetical protein
MNLQQSVQFALRLLMIASEFDAATGGVNPGTQTYATIKVLRPTGVETLEAEQQAQLLNA